MHAPQLLGYWTKMFSWQVSAVGLLRKKDTYGLTRSAWVSTELAPYKHERDHVGSHCFNFIDSKACSSLSASLLNRCFWSFQSLFPSDAVMQMKFRIKRWITLFKQERSESCPSCWLLKSVYDVNRLCRYVEAPRIHDNTEVDFAMSEENEFL